MIFFESGTDVFKRHFYGMTYFHKLKVYQITILAIVLNELH